MSDGGFGATIWFGCARSPSRVVCGEKILFGLLIALVYLAFIALGLPDSLLGSAWPVISTEFCVDSGLQGVVTMIIAGGTIVSSLMSDLLTKKFGTGLVTAVSVLLTAVALFGFSFSTALWHLCLWAVPYGLGAGAVDAALNNYAALHFSSRHLNWLHCFWGVGCCVSPYIMGACLSGGLGWNNGYRIVGLLQTVIVVLLFCALPLWKKVADKQKAAVKNDEGEVAADGAVDVKTDVDVKADNVTDVEPTADNGNLQADGVALSADIAPSSNNVLKLKGVLQTLLMFFCYCSAESIAMQWSSSYLVFYRGVEKSLAATFASLFFIGITVGRFVCGLVSDKLGDKKLITVGVCVMAASVVAIALPLTTDIVALGGLVLFGFGCAPVYPSIIHSTPSCFGEKNSQKIVGLQMSAAYCGTTFMPPLFGLVSTVAMWAFPVFLGGFTLLLFAMNLYWNKVTANNRKTLVSKR